MDRDNNPATLALLATLAIAYRFEANLLGWVYVSLVDSDGETVASDLIAFAARVGDETVLYAVNRFGEFNIEIGRGADGLLALMAPGVEQRTAELTYSQADDVRARRAYLATLPV